MFFFDPMERVSFKMDYVHNYVIVNLLINPSRKN
jgi:hypothetical protein